MGDDVRLMLAGRTPPEPWGSEDVVLVGSSRFTERSSIEATAFDAKDQGPYLVRG